MLKEDLIAFEEDVKREYVAKNVKAPIHLCDPNQARPLIEIFKDVREDDWVLCTWRSMYHALLKGVPPEKVKEQIMAGHCMTLNFPEHRFLSSAIMGGMLPIACGLATKYRVWCFVGDMCARTGAYMDAFQYCAYQKLPVKFVVEDNSLSTNTPTIEAWGGGCEVLADVTYKYKRNVGHYGIGAGSDF